MKDMIQGVAWALLPMLLLGGMGCAGYRLGPVNGVAAGARSVQVKFFDNQTLEPRLVSAVTHSLRQHLQQDGTFRVESEGDLVVNGVLKNFTRNGVNYKPSDVLAVRDYSLQLTAEVIVTDRVTGQVVLKRDIVGSSVVRVNTDFASGQRQAVPLIADQIALRATSVIADGTWPAGDPEPGGN
ncbi:MAG: LPS assembly lipoprotein LptE [Verrucomicrobiota bacterium]|jgi:hypothetical protein|nr:LPS assembly lipoprotein LptE [Verrucomicrobiota bacterium]